MKYLISAAAIVFCAALAAPAFAQSRQSEAEFQRFLSRHPDVQANPALLSDKNYLYHHPNIAKFLQEHPGIHQQAFMMGAYDQGHVWRDSGWWYQHDPHWAYQNHPEWWRSHPEWGPPVVVAAPAGIGDYDEHHVWRDRGWWEAHNRGWAQQHHPEWYAHHEVQSEHHEVQSERHQEHQEQKHHGHD
jgi:hypothetical protein